MSQQQCVLHYRLAISELECVISLPSKGRQGGIEQRTTLLLCSIYTMLNSPGDRLLGLCPFLWLFLSHLTLHVSPESGVHG